MSDELSALTVVFTELYYWVTVVLMFLIHVGFCLYEVGCAREKHKLNTLEHFTNEFTGSHSRRTNQRRLVL